LDESKGAPGWTGGLNESNGAPGWTGGLDESKGALGWTGGLNSPREHRGGPVTWLIPRSTRVAGDLVESKEHWVASGLVDSKECWGEPVAWLNPRSIGVETILRHGVGKLITSNGLHLERCGPWIRMEAFRDYLCIVMIRRNKDKVIK
jgi:hypothetical protein